MSLKREKETIDVTGIRKINFDVFLRDSNLRKYGDVSNERVPGSSHKGQPVLRALVAEYVFPLMDKGSVVLDLGCRNLDLAVFLSARVGRVVNVDISPQVVSWATQLGFDAVCASADNLQVESNSIDIFHASHVFEHVPDLAKSIFEAMRVLRIGGHLFVRVPLANYYRHHRYYIGSVAAMATEIQKQCPCQILQAKVGNGLGYPEAIVLAKKIDQPRFLPQKYPYDFSGTIRGMIWRVRNGHPIY